MGDRDRIAARDRKQGSGGRRNVGLLRPVGPPSELVVVGAPWEPYPVTGDPWRPLGVDTEGQVAEYDALYEGVPQWMQEPFWAWLLAAITVNRRYGDGSGSVPMLDTDLAEAMCQTLKIPFPNLRYGTADVARGVAQLKVARESLRKQTAPLQLADYLLAHGGHAREGDLDALLTRSKSAFQVGSRAGHRGLVRRVPVGVQLAVDSVIVRSERAGVRLAKAWEELYGLTPSASEAYRLAILAVEDAAVPVVAPLNRSATLGTVLKQMEDQGDWCLSLSREHTKAPTADVLIGMMRMLWFGQHDRHGGQPSSPGDVSIDESQVALSLAVTLVNWFHARLIARRV